MEASAANPLQDELDRAIELSDAQPEASVQLLRQVVFHGSL